MIWGTYKTANLRGAVMKTGVGSSERQTTKRMAAVTLRPPKTRRRSHRLTAECQRSSRSRRMRQSSEAQREDAGNCRSHAVHSRPTQELGAVTPQLRSLRRCCLTEALGERVAIGQGRS